MASPPARKLEWSQQASNLGATSLASLKSISKMNKEEMEAELLECARYGELEDMMAFLAEDEVSVDHTDDGGNSALHKVEHTN